MTSNALQPGIDEARLDGITRRPLPGFHQAPTQVHGASKVPRISNPPLVAYDTSEPYTDPEATIDLREGLAALRDTWIRARGDVVELTVGSELPRAHLLDDRGLDGVRFPARRRPRRAKPDRNVTQLHYARRGMVTPEMGMKEPRTRRPAA